MPAPLSPLASRLVALRRSNAAPAAADPALAPADFASAFAVQAEVLQGLGEQVGGWKVGVAPDGTPFGAPMLASGLLASGSALPLGPYLVIEMEIAVRLARDLAPGEHSREAVLDAVDEVIVGLELLRGRMGEPPAVAFNTFLADNGANLGYVVGAASRSFRALDLGALPCRLTLDGEVVHEAVGGHPQNDPVSPIRTFLARWPAAMGGLRAGQVITTGSLNKPVRLTRPARVVAQVEGLGRAELVVTG